MISYEDLLGVFWAAHSPTRQAWSRQYRAAIWYHDIAQEDAAVSSRDRIAATLRAPVATEIEPAGAFYIAEDYHQKYRLRSQRDMMVEFRRMYPTESEFVDSTAAARVNGFLDGQGTCDQLEEEIAGYGLSEGAQEHLRELVCLRNPAAHIKCT